MFKLVKATFISLLFVCLFGTCWSQDEFGKTDTKTEIEIGRQIVLHIDNSGMLSNNTALIERVTRISKALIEQIEPKMFPYEVKVLSSSDVNAFCLPGGFVYFYEGLLAMCPDDNALAAVIGHELAHGSHRHYMKRKSKMQGVKIGAILGSILTKSNYPGETVKLISLQYSRDDEYDADRTGQYYAWMAGYDPEGYIKVLELFDIIEGDNSKPEYLRTHPKPRDRIKYMQACAQELNKQTRPKSVPLPSFDLSIVAGKLPDARIDSNPYFPLSVGYEWVYCVQKDTTKTYYSVDVLSVSQLDAGNVYRMETRFGSNSSVTFQAFTTSNEIWRRNKPTNETSPWDTEYFINLSSDPIERNGWTYTFVGNEELTLPCGSFKNAAHIKKQKETVDSTIDLWFVENVGLVKRYTARTGVTEVLTLYNIPTE